MDRRAAGAALESVGRIGELLTLLEEEPAGLLRSGGVGRPGPEAAGPRAARRRARGGLAAGAGLRRRAARRRRAAPRRVAAHPRLRHLARAGPRRPLGRPGRRLAGRRPAAVAGRPARRRRQGGQPAVARPRPAHRPGDPPLGADRARRVPARRRVWPPTTWSPCCAGAPRGGPTGSRPVPGDARRGRPPRASSSAASCPRPGRGLLDRAARTARPTACAGCCPSRSTTCSPSPTSRSSRPGPLVSELADTLAVVADVESSGGATVFRVSESSVRRALDAGWSASDLHDFFARASRTPVPQALDYLVDDVARQHGRLRVGSIESYVRSDDHGLLSQVLNDRRAASAELRRLAPGVLVSGAGGRRGARPCSATPATPRPGRTRAAPSSPGRRPGRGPPADGPAPSPRPAPRPLTPGRARRHGAADARRGRRAVRPPRRGGAPGPGRDDGEHPRAALPRRRAGLPIWLGYVDAQGSGSQRVVRPVSLVGGFLQGYDERRGENSTFAVHRITSVALVEEDAGAPPRRPDPGAILGRPHRAGRIVRRPGAGRDEASDDERTERWPHVWRRPWARSWAPRSSPGGCAPGTDPTAGPTGHRS